MSATMKEVEVSQGAKTVIKDVAIPEAGPDQLLIKVIVSGCNPKDWYVFWKFRVVSTINSRF